MARGRGRLLGVAAVLTVLASGCSGDASSTSSARSTGPSAPTDSASETPDGLAFGECGDLVDTSLVELSAERLDHLTFECGILDVPLDHDDPTGETIGLAVVRIRDDRQGPRIGTLVMGAGGPGQSGLGQAPFWASWISDDILERFDVMTLDQRGVGASAGFDCPPTPRDEEPAKMVDLFSPAGWSYAVDAHRASSASCVEELGDRAGRFGTVAAAHDLDLLREAVGDDRLTFIGFSYGAKLGAEYARQFPDRVRAVVLDAPSHPRGDAIAILERQIAGFEGSLHAWAEDCPARPTCARIGDDPVGFVLDLMARARQMPIPSKRPLDDPAASDGDVISGLAALLKFQQFWPWLDDALAEMALGDSGTLREAIESGFGGAEDAPYDERDANLVINCTDARPGPAKAAILRATRRLVDTYPVFGMAGGWLLVGCKYWSGPRAVLPVPEDVGAPPIVVVGTRHDPATPYGGAVAMARVLGSGHLLTWDGYTHTAYGQTDCITQAVDAYLLDLVVPPEGTVCPAGG